MLHAGLVYTSWVPEHPWGFIPRKQQMAMGRMGITNLIMLLQTIFLSTFPSDTPMTTINTISLCVDTAYRVVVCVWFLQNGCRHVKTTLLSVLAKIASSYNRIINWIRQYPRHAAPEYPTIANLIPELKPEDPTVANLILEDPELKPEDPTIANLILEDPELNREEALEEPNDANLKLEDLNYADPHSKELMLNSNLEATTSACTSTPTAESECHFLHDSEVQAPQSVLTSVTEATKQHHSRTEVEPPMASFPYGVEEESSSLNNSALSSNNLFIPFPSSDNSHPECQKLIELHHDHDHNHLEFIQPFPDSSDLCAKACLFHNSFDQQSSEVFKPPQLESNTSFAPSFENFVPGMDVPSLLTGKTELEAGLL